MLPVTSLFFQYFKTSMNPVVLQVGELPEWDQKPLEENYQIIPYYSAARKDMLLSDHGRDVRAIVTRGELGADRQLIDACPAAEIVTVYGVGYDAVDVAHCQSKGIHVTNTPDVLTGDVADLGVAMLLCLQRQMTGASDWVTQGHWKDRGNYRLGRRVFGQRVGILGLGRIGYEVATRISGFNVSIYYSDVEPKTYAKDWHFIASAEQLATEVDVLFVTLAASEATRNIVNRKVIEALGKDGTLINISRASNIDEPALLTALETGKLGAAAIDVFDNEPDINPRWLALDNVLLQPHHASGTIETRKAMGQLMRDNLAAHFTGEPLPSPVTH